MASDVISELTAKRLTTFEQLLNAIRDKTARIGIVGLGYVGLPLVRAFVNAGYGGGEGEDLEGLRRRCEGRGAKENSGGTAGSPGSPSSVFRFRLNTAQQGPNLLQSFGRSS